MTIDLGNELFAIGVKSRLVLFDHGCHIKTKEHNVFAKWEEIGLLFTYGGKESLNGFTHSQKLGLSFEMTDGRIIPIEFKLFAILWGAEFLYHNHRTKKLFEVVAQHGVPIR